MHPHSVRPIRHGQEVDPRATNPPPGNLDIQWLFLLPTRRPEPAVLVWDIIGIDFSTHKINYFTPVEDTMNCIPTKLTSIQNFISHITAPASQNAPTWSTSAETISGIPQEHYGTWACLLPQVLLHKLSPSIISYSSLVDSGWYIASCLVRKSIPSFKSLLIQTTKQDKAAHVSTIPDQTVYSGSSPPPANSEGADYHSPEIYYPRHDELQGYLPGYNILHDNYGFSPDCDDDPASLTRSHLNSVSFRCILPVPAGRIREQLLALGSESNKCTILHSITMTTLDGVALLSTGLV